MTDTSFYSICVVIVDSTFYSIFLVEPTRLFLQWRITPEGHEICSTVFKERTVKLKLRVKAFSFFTAHLK